MTVKSVCRKRATCACTALVTAALECPTARQPMPPAKSMKVLPSTSVTSAPSALSTKTGTHRALASATTRSLRSIQARERGPGISVRISMDDMHPSVAHCIAPNSPRLIHNPVCGRSVMTENAPPAGSSSNAQRPGPMSSARASTVPPSSRQRRAVAIAVGRRDVDHPVRLGVLGPASRPSPARRRRAGRGASRRCRARRRILLLRGPAEDRAVERRWSWRCRASSARSRSASRARCAPRSPGARPAARPRPGRRAGSRSTAMRPASSTSIDVHHDLPAARDGGRARLRRHRRSPRRSTTRRRRCRPTPARARPPGGRRAGASGSRPHSRSARSPSSRRGRNRMPSPRPHPCWRGRSSRSCPGRARRSWASQSPSCDS